ncbi:MAG: hypothetical protein VX219_00760, partial [Actinomycetota bacterium]|nr:hypothetical protein [Actinomycetota bacterium]
MPFFLPVISFSLDAALVLYFVVSNLYRIGQQAYITRTLYGPGRDQPAVVIPERADSGKDAKKKANGKQGGGKQSAQNSKSGGGPSQKSSSPTRDQGLSEATKAGRTTAGKNSNHSQIIDEEAPSRGGSGFRNPKGSRNRKAAKPTSSTKKKADRRGRSKASDESATGDKRPPAGRSSGGRTTPPGTSGTRSAKKRRK